MEAWGTPVPAGSPAGSTGASTGASTPEPRWQAEEQAFLAGGPGRAAEVAVVSLVEAGAVRISREGLVSAVAGPTRAWSPLQAHVLRSLPRSLGDVIAATAASPEAGSLREHLIAGGLVVPPERRETVRRGRWLVLAAVAAAVFANIALNLPFVVVGAVVVIGILVTRTLNRRARPLTPAGRHVVRQLEPVAVPPNRIALVAYHGLLGRTGRQQVWEVLGIAPAAAATLRRRSRGGGSDGGSSCGSCSSSSCSGSDSGGDGCGGGGGGE